MNVCPRLSDGTKYFFSNFTQPPPLLLCVPLFPSLTWACYLASIDLPFFMTGLMKWRREKREICPSETSLNQCDVFTPALRWSDTHSLQPSFPSQAAQTLCSLDTVAQRKTELFELSTCRQTAETVGCGGNLHSGAAVVDSTWASPLLSEGEVRVICSRFLWSICQSNNSPLLCDLISWLCR